MSGKNQIKQEFLSLREKQRIDSLDDVSKWTPYLKYIYQALSRIANEFFDDNRHYPKISNEMIGKQECIENIAKLLITKLIFDKMCIKKSKLFDKEDLKLTKDEPVIEQIYNSIKKTLEIAPDPLDDNCIKPSDLSLYYDIKYVVDKYKVEFVYSSEPYSIYGGGEKILAAYLANIPSKKDNKRMEIKKNVHFVLIQFMCLNDKNRCYQRKIDRIPFVSVEVIKQRRKEFNKLTISELDLKDADYKIFVQNIVDNYDLYSFALGEDDYDVRNYPDPKLFDAIKNALPTKEQKDKFQQFLKSKNEPKFEEKERKEQSQPKQEKDKSKCEIF